MDSLSSTNWDVVISGTGLAQSLLALALSRSGKQILHIDRNDYYGGRDAAFSLQDASSWVTATTNGSGPSTFQDAQILHIKDDQELPSTWPKSVKLGFSRAYSLALSPQLIYTRSALLPTLVSSKVYRQLEFLAVGSWWIHDEDTSNEGTKESGQAVRGTLNKIPGGREDVFADETIDRQFKRSLMKFLRLAVDVDAQEAILQKWGTRSFDDFLSCEYRLSTQLRSALHALTLSLKPIDQTTTSYALPRITRHLTSIGVFGPGFGSVVPKWGGVAEIAQVACRALAVGGGVYVLNKGIQDVVRETDKNSADEGLAFKLDGGETITTKWFASDVENFPLSSLPQKGLGMPEIARSITILSSTLSELFPLPMDGAPPPAVAVVAFPALRLPDEERSAHQNPVPVYLMIHSSDTGECPPNQCVVYATVGIGGQEGQMLLATAINKMLDAIHEDMRPITVWSLRYSQHRLAPREDDNSTQKEDGKGHRRIIMISEPAIDLAFDDSVLREVRSAWQQITGQAEGFMQFEDREAETDDDDDM